jgi:anti-sigma regulatory factor (Ser/Thr protein kinase)
MTPTLVHQAFTYGDTDEFTAAMVPFVRDGLQAGDAVCVVTGRSNISALREGLGDEASGVDFHESRDWYRNPYQTMSAWARYVDQHADGRAARLIGEPVWEGRSAASIREWTRYESAVNIAFADSPAWCVCLYNEATLPEDIIAHARCTHPEVLDDDGTRPSPEFLHPSRLFESIADGDAPPPDADVTVFEVGDVSEARRHVGRVAEDAGLSRVHLSDWTLAVSELLTNGARHGREPVRFRLWRDDGELVAEVADTGHGLADHLAGCMPPPPEATSGRGLWLVRQLADSVDFCRTNNGFAVRMRFGLGTATS